MKKILLAMTLLLLSFAGCTQKEQLVLRIGISPWPGYEPIALASQKGLYGDVDVRIIRFSTPTESFRALRDGIIDVAAFTADEVFHYAEVRKRPRMFLVVDISNGADALVAKESIRTIDDLKGKRVALEESALSHYVLSRALDLAQNTTITDLTLKTIDIGEHEKAFRADEIDAAVTYEPSKGRLLNAGAHVLFDTTQMPNEVVDVCVANEETLKEKSKELKAFAKGWFQALDHIRSNKESAMGLMAENEGSSIGEFTKAYNSMIIPTKAENETMLGAMGSLQKPMQRLAALMLEKGSLEKAIDVRPLIDSSVLESLKK